MFDTKQPYLAHMSRHIDISVGAAIGALLMGIIWISTSRPDDDQTRLDNLIQDSLNWATYRDTMDSAYERLRLSIQTLEQEKRTLSSALTAADAKRKGRPPVTTVDAELLRESILREAGLFRRP